MGYRFLEYNIINFIFSSFIQQHKKDEMKCENVKWKMWWYEEDFKCIDREAYKNSMNSCQLIPTHYYDKQQLN